MKTQTPSVTMADTNPLRPPLARVALGVIASGTLGLAAVTLPAVHTHWRAVYSLPPFTLEKLGIDHFQPISVAFLILAGVLASFIIGRGRWALAGLSTMLAFPVLMLVEMIRDSTSHNLFPFELISYAVLAIPGLTAAALTDWLRGRFEFSTRRA
ncbi:MAG: hypothetical protein IT432_00195 [Phycisphaerales bacterium]|nr:hypothetical protein [Phycisphaerales bacterium]